MFDQKKVPNSTVTLQLSEELFSFFLFFVLPETEKPKPICLSLKHTHSLSLSMQKMMKKRRMMGTIGWSFWIWREGQKKLTTERQIKGGKIELSY